jgi:UDP-N-acetylmuramate dehydrogenase
VLGNGSNLLVSDEGYDGVVVRVGSAFGFIEDAGPDRLRIGAGTLWSRVLLHVMREGVTGLEYGTGIPGTIGGAVATNAGTRGGDTAECLVDAEVVGRDGEPATMTNSDLEFRYRNADGLPPGTVVTAVRFAIERTDPQEVTATIRRYQAERRRDQPEREPSAGCIFKNPPGGSAGRLIDLAGLKGMEEGGAVVSPAHGNFIINRGGATSADVMRLIERIRERIRAEHDVELELEVRTVGLP